MLHPTRNYSNTQHFLNWELSIWVGEVNGYLQANVGCKGKMFVLPQWIDGLYKSLCEYTEEPAAIYDIIGTEVNRMITDLFGEKYTFEFPPLETPAKPTINILSWATPSTFDWTEPRVTNAYVSTANACESGMTYITADEYENMRQEWRLQAGEIYVVMN